MIRRGLLLFLFVACGDNGESRPDAAIDPSASFDDTEAWVELAIGFSDSDRTTSVSGNTITDALFWPYDEASREGSCRLWTREIEQCAGECEWPIETCVDGVCVTAPASRSAGTLTFRGGGETRAVPFANESYQLFERTHPFPAGTEVTVTAPGDVVGAFTASAVLPQRLEMEGLDALRLRTGEPLVLRWLPADPGSRVRITLGADFGHATYRPVVVECDAPDDLGSISVPQGMVDQLAAGPWACGFCIGQEAKRYRRVTTSAGALPMSFWAVQRVGFDLRPINP